MFGKVIVASSVLAADAINVHSQACGPFYGPMCAQGRISLAKCKALGCPYNSKSSFVEAVADGQLAGENQFAGVGATGFVEKASWMDGKSYRPSMGFGQARFVQVGEKADPINDAKSSFVQKDREPAPRIEYGFGNAVRHP